MRDSWLRFWDRPNAIYVNDRHRRVHYARIADDILSILPARPGLRVLDWGCGQALEAARVAERCARLFLYDAAPSVREGLAERHAAVRNIEVVDEAGLAALGDGTVDVITVSSVIQYIDKAELPAVLRSFRRLLAADGVLVIADVIPPEVGMVDDVRSLLGTAARHGFLPAALAGLAATLFSDYRRFRRDIGLSTYGDDEFRNVLADAGLRAERHSRNLGFHPVRRTYLARPG